MLSSCPRAVREWSTRGASTASLPPCHGFCYLEVFPAIQPCSVFHSVIPSQNLSPRPTAAHPSWGTGAAPEGGAGRRVSLRGDGQSWRLPEDLQDTRRRGEMTLPSPLPQAPSPRKRVRRKGPRPTKATLQAIPPKGLQRVSSRLFGLGLIQKPGPLKGFFILGLEVLCFQQCRFPRRASRPLHLPWPHPDSMLEQAAA